MTMLCRNTKCVWQIVRSNREAFKNADSREDKKFWADQS